MAGDSKYSCAGDNAIHRREQRKRDRAEQMKIENFLQEIRDLLKQILKEVTHRNAT